MIDANISCRLQWCTGTNCWCRLDATRVYIGPCINSMASF